MENAGCLWRSSDRDRRGVWLDEEGSATEETVYLKKKKKNTHLSVKNLFQVVMAPVKWFQGLINAGANGFC